MFKAFKNQTEMVVTQHREYTNATAHFKIVSFMLCEFLLNKEVLITFIPLTALKKFFFLSFPLTFTVGVVFLNQWFGVFG